nr:hypothetical protein MFMH1_17220 [Myxococcus sp. MH1]
MKPLYNLLKGGIGASVGAVLGGIVNVVVFVVAPDAYKQLVVDGMTPNVFLAMGGAVGGMVGLLLAEWLSASAKPEILAVNVDELAKHLTSAVAKARMEGMLLQHYYSVLGLQRAAVELDVYARAKKQMRDAALSAFMEKLRSNGSDHAEGLRKAAEGILPSSVHAAEQDAAAKDAAAKAAAAKDAAAKDAAAKDAAAKDAAAKAAAANVAKALNEGGVTEPPRR